jgi:hypothetical protein
MREYLTALSCNLNNIMDPLETIFNEELANMIQMRREYFSVSNSRLEKRDEKKYTIKKDTVQNIPLTITTVKYIDFWEDL